MHTSALLHGLVHAPIFLAGYVFTASLVGPDPDPHRSSTPVRAVVLVGFVAAQSILAKWLYAHPPAGVESSDGQVGAQLMYDGGDMVDVTLIVLLFTGWYAATRPRGSVPPDPAMGTGHLDEPHHGSLTRLSAKTTATTAAMTRRSPAAREGVHGCRRPG